MNPSRPPTRSGTAERRQRGPSGRHGDSSSRSSSRAARQRPDAGRARAEGGRFPRARDRPAVPGDPPGIDGGEPEPGVHPLQAEPVADERPAQRIRCSPRRACIRPRRACRRGSCERRRAVLPARRRPIQRPLTSRAAWPCRRFRFEHRDGPAAVHEAVGQEPPTLEQRLDLLLHREARPLRGRARRCRFGPTRAVGHRAVGVARSERAVSSRRETSARRFASEDSRRRSRESSAGGFRPRPPGAGCDGYAGRGEQADR